MRKLRKKYQRKLNKLIKLMNENIKNDSLWRGRFYARQIQYFWYPFEDNSSGVLTAIIRFYDKKTGKTQDIPIEYFGHGYFVPDHVWRAMNDFIVDYCNVWQTEDRDSLYNDTTDYSKIEVK